MIILITKMDRFRGIQRETARDLLEPTTYEASPQERVDLDQKYSAFAAKKVQERIDLIEKEMRGVDKAHFDAFVAVARCLSW